MSTEYPEGFAEFISKLKANVRAMLRHRAQLHGQQGFHQPPKIWSEALASYRYLLNLSPEDFLAIRTHWEWRERFGYAPWGIDAEHDPAVIEYAKAIRSVPPELWLSEPLIPAFPYPMGIPYRDRYVNPDIVRYQHCVTNLHVAGAFDILQRAYGSEPYTVIEIGGGFGGLAHQLARLLPGNAVWVSVDLPELFMLQGPYLYVNNPGKSIMVYEPGRSLDQPVCMEHDFILWPNFELEQLETLPNIAMVINLLSFQEMTAQQVERYVSFAESWVELCLYSDNWDKHPDNPEALCVSSVLERHLELWPAKEEYDRYLSGRRELRKYYCLPHNRPFARELRLPDKRSMAGTVFLRSQWKNSMKGTIPAPVKRLLRRLARL